MSLIEAALEFANNYFRPTILIIGSLLAIYFYSKKIGNNITVNYTITSSVFEKTRIDDIVLNNHKDKPVVIWSVHAIFNNEIRLVLAEFHPPKILKPLESLAFSTQKYSNLELRGGKFEPRFEEAEILILSDTEIIKCTRGMRPLGLEQYILVFQSKRSFNGHIFDENAVKFILVYTLNDEVKTAFIKENGYIGNEWDLQPIMIEGGATKQSIIIMLRQYGYDGAFSSFLLYEVRANGDYELVFDSSDKHG